MFGVQFVEKIQALSEVTGDCLRFDVSRVHGLTQISGTREHGRDLDFVNCAGDIRSLTAAEVNFEIEKRAILFESAHIGDIEVRGVQQVELALQVKI